jgi:Phasin protein
MAKTQDYTKVLQDMMSALPFDTTSAQGAFKTSAALGEKMAKVALEAAEKSNEISSKWTKETISKVGSLTKVKEEPADYTKAFSDFASAAAELAAENLAAFAEIAKKAQMDTVELMLAAGKTASEDATAAVQKATAEVTNAAKKVSAAAK